jgi:hypothetical protein
MRRYISTASGTALTDTKLQKQQIVNWILAASKQIETFLGRLLKLDTYTEYFDTPNEKDVFFSVKGYPITTLTDVYIDGDGAFDGGESEITDCITSKNADMIILPTQPGVRGYKTIRARYTGGLAVDGVRSTFAIANVVNTWTVGNYAAGGNSEAVGIVKSVSATQMIVEVLYGIFEDEETLTEYTDENLTTTDPLPAAADISAITSQSLAESYPDIVRACEIQVRHYWKHKDDFELTSTQKDATNQRAFTQENRNPLTPEVMALLNPYRRMTL